jgi:hypothetical protein
MTVPGPPTAVICVDVGELNAAQLDALARGLTAAASELWVELACALVVTRLALQVGERLAVITAREDSPSVTGCSDRQGRADSSP